jgi:hypothetical protein
MAVYNPNLSEEVLNRFLCLDQNDQIQAEYVWIGGTGQDLRSKCRTLPTKEGGYKPEDLPEWNFDGSSTQQALPHPSRLSYTITSLCWEVEVVTERLHALVGKARHSWRLPLGDRKVVRRLPS